MPQVDLESLMCGCGDGKVACETVIGPPDPKLPSYPDSDPDLPAESFQVRIGDDIDWVDINAVYDRDDSTKGTTNPKSHHHSSSNPTSKPHSHSSNSQRFSGNLKATTKAHIIGLPNKIQHTGYLGHSGRRPTPSGRIFLKTAGRAKSAGLVLDPGSPAVSCFGKVLSESERERCRRIRQQSPEKGAGCWAALFRCFGGGGERKSVVEESNSDRRSKDIPTRDWKLEAAAKADPQPGFGGMRRFASGRRAASWGGDVEADEDLKEDGHVAWSGPLDREGLRDGR